MAVARRHQTPGRPGWHIECSAMAWKHLGETFDIHGGGIDLVFPHHENEIAQSRCAFHTDVMANYWMHNGFLQVEGEKMSKSLGNFFTIHDLLADWPGEVLRFNMLRTHYRQPIDWTVKGLEESWKTLDDWYWIVADAPGETPSGAGARCALRRPQYASGHHRVARLAQSGAGRRRDSTHRTGGVAAPARLPGRERGAVGRAPADSRQISTPGRCSR